MEVSGSHGGAKQQQRVFVVVGSCRESLGAIGSHWESLEAVGVNFPTKVPGERCVDVHIDEQFDGPKSSVARLRGGS